MALGGKLRIEINEITKILDSLQEGEMGMLGMYPATFGKSGHSVIVLRQSNRLAIFDRTVLGYLDMPNGTPLNTAKFSEIASRFEGFDERGLFNLIRIVN